MINKIRSVRKRWLIVTAAVALLAVGLVSGAAFASNARANHVANSLNYGHGDGTGKGRHGYENSTALMGRVAEILGVEQATLESAFSTAIDEQAETKFDARVAQLVADESLTQEQGDAATSWFEERPALSGPIAIRLAGTSDAGKVDNFLAKLVEKEKLSQDESDALNEWHDDRPDSLPEVEGRHKRHHGSDGDGDSSGDNGDNA